MLDTRTYRPLRPDDAAAWARLLAAAEAVDRSGEHYSAADLAEELATPGLDLTTDSLAVLVGDELVGATVLLHRRGATGVGDTLSCDGVVHPERRGEGVGRRLLEFGRARAGELGATLILRVMATDDSAVALAEAFGLAPLRWWAEMRRDLTDPVAPAPVPADVELHPLGPGYDAQRWDGPLRAAHNVAFAQHWGSAATSAEAWRQQRTGSSAFRAELSAAVTAGDGQVVAYLLGYEYDAVAATTGSRELYVATVGTVPEWRGRGLAGALLAHVLARAAAGGFGVSRLTADTQNATGAVGVYERVGYSVERRAVTYGLAFGA